MLDKFREECGVFGIWGHPDAVECTGLGLAALQHRGQDSSGIAVSESGRITRLCQSGTVENLTDDPAFADLRSKIAIGHVRYSTVGDNILANAQPIVLECRQGEVGLCHNGQLVNFEELKKQVTTFGAELLTSSDSELILQVCRNCETESMVDALLESLPRLEGAFALLLLANDELIATRDPHGFRPLCMGRLGDAVVFCSETCALDAIGARYCRDVQPGEVIVVGVDGVRSISAAVSERKAHCVFEHVYFARPDSYVFGQNVGAVRSQLGRNLGLEAPVDADLIVPVPESGMWVAMGYHEATGLPIQLGLVRNFYVPRTFIDARADRRDKKVQLKLNPVSGLVAGKRIVLIDDSIVRGTTMNRIVKSMRQAGAREVHVRIGSPPTVGSCFYGINTPSTDELIASNLSLEEVRTHINADSLAYLSLEGLLQAVGANRSSYCTACYTGKYLVRPSGMVQLKKKQEAVA